MTWRAFILGLLIVVFMCWADVWAGLSRGYGWTTEGHFPEACAFLLVVLTLVINVVIKLVRRTAGLRQSELMLIWCMLIIAAVFPTTGLFRLWLPAVGGPAYFAGRGDIAWKDTSLASAPDTLLLSKNPASFEVRQFYEGGGEEARVPWSRWVVPLTRWLLLFAFFYMAIFFLCGILRKQWVEREHLLFPLARVPLEFTEASSEERLLPAVCYERSFQIGFVGAIVFRLVRAIPVFGGGPTAVAWDLQIPLGDVLQGTPLKEMYMANFPMWWPVIGWAFLVPADVSLSVWFFYLFGRVELQTAAWLGSPLQYGGSWSDLMRWQMAGSYIAFTVGTLYMTRRHLADVARKAVGMGKQVDDSEEPVSYRLAFWGLLVCGIGFIAWTAYYSAGTALSGISRTLLPAVITFLVVMCIQLVHARIVAQSGLYWTWLIWNPPNVLHSLSLGHFYGPVGAVVAHMQRGIMLHNVSLSPAAIHCFRIGEVFNRRRRRFLLPVMMVAVVVAIVVCCITFLDEAYMRGVLNFQDAWGNVGNPQGIFSAAHQVIERPFQMAQPRWLPFGLGIGLTGFVMVMRARFYWWPIHSIGLLAISNWSADRMWLPFLLGWLTKLGLMKFSGGRAVRKARLFFIAFILADASMTVVSTILGALSGGSMNRF